MPTFLQKIVTHFVEKQTDLGSLCFVLPSVRAGVFLRRAFYEQVNKPFIMPEIVNIDRFIAAISGLHKADSLELLFQFYETYLSVYEGTQPDNFENFSKWAFLLVQDFNEIDKNLKDASEIFTYLADAKRIDALFKAEGKMHGNSDTYINFLSKIPKLYNAFYRQLKSQGKGYQGLIYREAIVQMEQFLKKNDQKTFVFAGFNALTRSEEHIFNYFLDSGNAQIFWDIDRFFWKPDEQVSKFIRQHKKWPYFNTHPFQWISNDFASKKEVEIIGVPKQVGQVKYVSELLASKSKGDTKDYQNTALILADESLLTPLLNSLPESVQKVNITMGFPLQQVKLSSLFDQFFKLHLYRSQMGKTDAYYLPEVINFLNFPEFQFLFDKQKINEIQSVWIEKNRVWIPTKDLKKLFAQAQTKGESLDFLFQNFSNDIPGVLKSIDKLIDLLHTDETLSLLEKEYLLRFKTLFTRLTALNATHPYINNLQVLYGFYKQLLKNENLSFKGEPLEGLQIMGLLESRLLDFEQVIITSVNEGILPEGKKSQTFLPFDIKQKYGINTYQEKDAIFAYHFFSLLQRAKKIHLVYNTEFDDFGMGEQSRFIKQLELASEMGQLPHISLSKKIIVPNIKSEPETLLSIPKDQSVIERLKQIAEKGFSPSALTAYIRNPIDFYKKRILGIQDPKNAEEDVAFNTYGTIVHASLEELYKNYKGKKIHKEDIKKIQQRVERVVHNNFLNEFDASNLQTGRNFLSVQVAVKYIRNFLIQDLKTIQEFGPIHLVDVEKELNITHFHKELGVNICLYGIVDRIDIVNGVYRIIDYKTGKVAAKDLKPKNWDELILDYKWSKAFQVLYYALLFTTTNSTDLDKHPVEAGIYSFKNMKGGFLKFNGSTVTQEDLNLFTTELDKLILEIFDFEKPFDEKEIKTFFKKY